MATTGTVGADASASNKDASSTTATLLGAIASTQVELTISDVENQREPTVQDTVEGDGGASDEEDERPAAPAAAAPSIEKPLPSESVTASRTAENIGIFADEDDTASVFSFDSYEKQPRIPLRIQNMIRKQHRHNNDNEGDDNENDVDPNRASAVPFPSVVGASLEYENKVMVNVCPCRCLFFTLKETICLIMSLLGCLVFLAGLILLCMYLEGSIFNENNE